MDLAAIAATLGGALVDARPLPGGVSATVTALTLDTGRTVVIRQPGGTPDLEPERRLLAALRPHLPVPEPLACGPGWLATALVDGAPDPGPADLAAFARQLRAIHAVPLAALDPLPARPLALEPSTLAAQRTIAAALDHLAPPLTAPHLLHGDYWPGNLLWRDGRVVAVVDWEMAAQGDPLSDVATARLEILWSRGLEAMHEFTRLYGPTDPRALAAWDLWTAHRKLRRLPHWGLPTAEYTRMSDLLDRFWRLALPNASQ